MEKDFKNIRKEKLSYIKKVFTKNITRFNDQTNHHLAQLNLKQNSQAKIIHNPPSKSKKQLWKITRSVNKHATQGKKHFLKDVSTLFQGVADQGKHYRSEQKKQMSMDHTSTPFLEQSNYMFLTHDKSLTPNKKGSRRQQRKNKVNNTTKAKLSVLKHNISGFGSALKSLKTIVQANNEQSSRQSMSNEGDFSGNFRIGGEENNEIKEIGGYMIKITQVEDSKIDSLHGSNQLLELEVPPIEKLTPRRKKFEKLKNFKKRRQKSSSSLKSIPRSLQSIIQSGKSSVDQMKKYRAQQALNPLTWKKTKKINSDLFKSSKNLISMANCFKTDIQKANLLHHAKAISIGKPYSEKKIHTKRSFYSFVSKYDQTKQHNETKTGYKLNRSLASRAIGSGSNGGSRRPKLSQKLDPVAVHQAQNQKKKALGHVYTTKVEELCDYFERKKKFSKQINGTKVIVPI